MSNYNPPAASSLRPARVPLPGASTHAPRRARHSSFAVKRLPDGRALLNLGCGTKMDWRWVNVDFSPYTRLVRHRRLSRALHLIGLLSDDRYAKLQRVDPEIVSWDLSRGVPFADSTFDVVYHSHVLEHLPREAARGFLAECFRVLRPGGVLRVVVPDLRQLAESYLAVLERVDSLDPSSAVVHNDAVEMIFDQMVRTAAAGTSRQRSVVRVLERLLRGGPGQIGELHRWMYDRFSLTCLFTAVGFTEIEEHTFRTSRIPDWNDFRLDLADDEHPHKRLSLYLEGVKP